MDASDARPKNTRTYGSRRAEAPSEPTSGPPTTTLASKDTSLAREYRSPSPARDSTPPSPSSPLSNSNSPVGACAPRYDWKAKLAAIDNGEEDYLLGGVFSARDASVSPSRDASPSPAGPSTTITARGLSLPYPSQSISPASRPISNTPTSPLETAASTSRPALADSDNDHEETPTSTTTFADRLVGNKSSKSSKQRRHEVSSDRDFVASDTSKTKKRPTKNKVSSIILSHSLFGM